MNEYQRVAQKAEMQIKNKVKTELTAIRVDQISSSICHLEISLDKLVEELKSAQHNTNIENIYYHIGAIKGALQ